MKIDANDPRWTAYALGELEDEKERAELESILRQSEEMRLLVEEIRQTAGWLNEGLKEESPFGLTQAQRERIAAQSAKRTSWFWSKPAWALATAAAVLALGLSFWMYELEIGRNKINTQVAQVADRLEQVPAPDSNTQAEIGVQTEHEILSQPPTVAGAAKENSKAEAENNPLSDKPELIARNTTDLSAAAASPARRNAPKAMIEGNVTDSSGGVLPGVTIEVENVESGATTTTSTDESGAYNLSGLTPGEYRLKAKMPGFQTRAFKDVHLAESKANELDMDMEVAGISEEIEVVSSAKNLLVESSPSVGTILTESDLAKAQAGTGGGYGRGTGVAINSYVPAPPPPIAETSTRVVGVAAGKGRGIPRMPVPVRPREDERIYPPYPPPPPNFNTEGYASILDNPFLEVVQNPLSTFSIDVDTASYANVRRFLESSQLPPRDAVRIEELVNYFDYDYKGPGREGPFAAHFEMTEAPWNPDHRLLRIGLKAKEIESRERPKTNLVFLIDVSGSMSAYNKLPLVQQAMHLLVDRLTGNDHVSIVTYAGSTRIELPSTRGDDKWSIHRAIDRLRSGGSTAGASGIQLAYETANRNFIEGGANRVILATDGDFNVGMTNHGDLARFIEEKADSGVFLSALGFGMGNYKDDTLELLANRGRGNYAYIDTIDEARKVLVDEIDATLVSVAKDVKIQVEFNPGQVAGYRLIGYEDRIMPKEDFNNDAKKAGVIGAGHAVTALYEIVPAGKPVPVSGVDPLKYQKPVETTRATSSREAATVKIRYKEPEGEESRLMEFTVEDSGRKFDKASGDFKFAASVAAFGMVLRDSPYKGGATLEDALAWARDGRGKDLHGYRDEFIRLIHRAISIEK